MSTYKNTRHVDSVQLNLYFAAQLGCILGRQGM